MKRALVVALLLLALVALLVAAPLAASPAEEAGHDSPAAAAAGHDGEEHGEGGHAAETFLGLPKPVFLTINLLIFLGGLTWFAGPVLVGFLDDKRQELRHALDEAARQQREAAAMEARLAEQIAELRREVEELTARAEREGERERQEIVAEAEREQQRLQAAVHGEIEQGLLHARQQLTARAAQLASDLAEQRLAAGLTRADRQKIFRDNLARLQRLGGREQA